MTTLSADQTVPRRTVAKVTRRLLPVLFLMYCAILLVRGNVGLAALQMRAALGFSATVFGFGAGIFILGYSPFGIPSNLILTRLGARRWISPILIASGVLGASMMLVRGPVTYYVLRFLLGVAEAGFFPGIIYYLSHWMPAAHRARAAALFMTAIPAAGVLSGLLAGVLLPLQGRLGLDGWQWLFLVDGLPAVILGALGFVVLTDAPGHAAWLAPEERAWLVETLHTEQASSRQPARSWRDALADPTVWRLGSLTFLMLACAYAYGLWSPQMLKSVSGFSDTRVSLLTSAIAAAAVVGMLLNAAHSDRHQERRLHIAAAAFLAGLGWLLCLWADHGPMAVVAFALIAIGINSAYGPLWAVPGAYLTGPARASGIALIVALGSVGGFVGPNLIGITRDATGGYQAAYLTLGLMACGAGLLALRLRSARP